MGIFDTVRTGLSDAWNGTSPVWSNDLKADLETAYEHTLFVQQGITHAIPVYHAVAENLSAITRIMQVNVRLIPSTIEPASGGIPLTALKWTGTGSGVVYLESKFTKVIARLSRLSSTQTAAAAETGIELELLGSTAVEGVTAAEGVAGLAARAASIAKWAGRTTLLLTVVVVGFEVVLGGINVAKRRGAIQKLNKELAEMEKEIEKLEKDHHALRAPLAALLGEFADKDADGAFIQCIVLDKKPKIYTKKLLDDYDQMLSRLKEHNGKMTVAAYEKLCDSIRGDVRAIRNTTQETVSSVRIGIQTAQTQVNMAYPMARKMNPQMFREFTKTLDPALVRLILDYVSRHQGNSKILAITPQVQLGPDGKIYLSATKDKVPAPRRTDVL